MNSVVIRAEDTGACCVATGDINDYVIHEAAKAWIEGADLSPTADRIQRALGPRPDHHLTHYAIERTEAGVFISFTRYKRPACYRHNGGVVTFRPQHLALRMHIVGVKTAPLVIRPYSKPLIHGGFISQ